MTTTTNPMTTADPATSAAPATGWNAVALQELREHGGERPLLFTGARITTLDPLIGTVTGDVLVGGDRIVGVGPGIVTAAGDDGAIVVHAAGTTILPAVVDTLAVTGARAQRSEHVATLTPGGAADLLVLDDADAVDLGAAVSTLLRHPERVRALVAGGRLVRWDGQDLTGQSAASTATAAGVPAPQDSTGSPHLGVWVDATGFLHQELTAEGRYDETRGGRPHAFQGSFWIDGDRIDYLDDLGFWAFGRFIGEELHHAGYVMRRR